MPAYSKVTRHGQITLPASVRKELGIEEGDLIEIEVIDEKAMLVPKRLVDKRPGLLLDQKMARRGERGLCGHALSYQGLIQGTPNCSRDISGRPRLKPKRRLASRISTPITVSPFP